MSDLSAYQGYEIIGLTVDLRHVLDPQLVDRLLHGGLDGISHAEAEDIIHQLRAVKAGLS
jgi:hypothetical protein